MKKDKLTFGIILAAIFLLVTGITYAYFSLVVYGNDGAELVETTLGTLRIDYTDGSYINASQIEPGWTGTKTLTVENKGTVNISYELIFQKLYNEIINKEMKYSAVCESNIGTCRNISTTKIEEVTPEETNVEIKNGILIKPGEIHTYTFTFEFIETGSNQNYNQGKLFYGQLGVIEAQPKTYDLAVHLANSDLEDLSGYTVEFHSDVISSITDEYGTAYLSGLQVPSTHEIVIKNNLGTEVTRKTVEFTLGNVETMDEGKVVANNDLDFFSLNIQLDSENKIDTIDANANTLMNPYESFMYIAADFFGLDDDGKLAFMETDEFDILYSELMSVLSNLPAFWNYSSEISSIEFEDELNPIIGAAYEFDVSRAQNHSVMAYLVDDGNDMYELHIQGDGGVYAPYCILLFGGMEDFGLPIFINVSSITGFENLITSNADNMALMFGSLGADVETSFDIDFSSLDISNATSLTYMFHLAGQNAQTFDLGDLSNWDTSNVTDMSYLFNFAGGNTTTWSVGNVSGWDTSNVTNMNAMFRFIGQYVSTFELDLSNLDTSNVTTMGGMFEGAGQNSQTFELNLSNWDTSKVTVMSGMFDMAGQNSQTFELNLSNWDTSNIKDMSRMFSDAGSNATAWSVGDLSNWDTSNVTNMSHMFSNAGSNATAWSVGDLSNWDVSKVIDMSWMFNGIGRNSTTWSVGNISEWDTSSVESMSGMFSGTGQNAASFELDLSGWVTSSVVYMSAMFQFAGQNSQTFDIGNLSNWDTSNVSDMTYMFLSAGEDAEYSLNLSGWSVPLVTKHYGFNSGVESKITQPVWVH